MKSSPSPPRLHRHHRPATLTLLFTRTHTLVHSLFLLIILSYRFSTLFDSPTLPLLFISISELLLSFVWLLSQPPRWSPLYRTPNPHNLPSDHDHLPSIDVFICTADPGREPTVDVMNTVVSAMGLEYPARKVSVYVGDDAGAEVTVVGCREAKRFAKRSWLPFCRRWGVVQRCPKVFFEEEEEVGENGGGGGEEEFRREKTKVKEEYEVFVERVVSAMRKYEADKDANKTSPRDHPPLVQVISDDDDEEEEEEESSGEEVPRLVYVAREKRPSYPHNFKAGSLNALLRVSALMSNADYILVLDCDMYCNDPSSARLAMCFHLDPELESSLAFVQFPQKFHNISRTDIYDSALNMVFELYWPGMDGLRGPCLSGTGFYMKKKALYGSLASGVDDLMELRRSFGSSNKFIESLHQDYQLNASSAEVHNASLNEAHFVACCDYERQTKWGQEVGFLYYSVVEDYFTGFILHCKGWISVFCNPARPQFLGTAATNLNDVLIQGSRWSAGLVEVSLSKYCPLIYGPSKMSLPEKMIYTFISIYPLCYSSALWLFVTIPQLCLFYNVPLYPKVPSPLFGAFTFILLSSMLRSLYEILMIGSPARSWFSDQRMWMIKSLTSYFYGSLEAVMKALGLRPTSFVPTNKVVDVQQQSRYLNDVYDFQTSNLYLIPIVSVVLLSFTSFLAGVLRGIMTGIWDVMFAQLFISGFISCMSYPVVGAMLLREDNGRIPLSTTVASTVTCTVFLALGSLIFL